MPCKFAFTYVQYSSAISVFMSTKIKHPTTTTSEVKREKKNPHTVNFGGKGMFRYPWIYVALQSVDACTVTISISFPNQIEKREKRKLQIDGKPIANGSFRSLNFSKMGSTLPIKAEEKVRELIRRA